MEQQTNSEKRKRYIISPKQFAQYLWEVSVLIHVSCEDLNIIPSDYGRAPLLSDKQMRVMSCAMVLHGHYIVRVVKLFLKYYAEINIRIY
jgi:hypothetical protein